ncbi:unnamed protein product [Diplocarpon coronariae]
MIPYQVPIALVRRPINFHRPSINPSSSSILWPHTNSYRPS